MDKGLAGSTTKLLAASAETPEGYQLSLAHRQLHRRAMTESARLERWRGSSGCIGVQAAARVARSSPHEIYGAKRGPAERRVTLLADMLDEPDDDRVVEMLEALGPEDSAYYSKREHVVRGGSRSEALYHELVDRFVFVAGAQSEYEKYFNRPLPAGMWGWALESEVQALAGFAAVAKKPKNGIVRQRKLLMCVPGNYLMEDGKSAAELGLHGGAALGRTMIDRSEGGLAVASLDQSNAFSSVKVPEWLSYFQCCPALRPVPTLFFPLSVRFSIVST